MVSPFHPADPSFPCDAAYAPRRTSFCEKQQAMDCVTPKQPIEQSRAEERIVNEIVPHPLIFALIISE